ncbi:hypothetical protein P175DRAFT_0436525, partial [Aspergillus ochraceoroseus IBT 24754]
GVLKFLLILKHAWQDISIDFIIYLLLNNNYNTILVIVNYLIKIKYFLPCTRIINTKEIANLYLKYI